MVALKHVHACAEIVVDGGCVDSIAAKTLLTDLSRSEEASESPSRLINVIEDRSKTTVREGLIGVVVLQCNLIDGVHVAGDSNIILATGLIDRTETHQEEELLLRSKLGLIGDGLSSAATSSSCSLGWLSLGHWWVLNVSPKLSGFFERSDGHLVVCRILIDQR